MAREFTLAELVDGVRAAERRALARAITLVENGDPLAEALVREVYPATGRAATVGLTGPPGAGKSTLASGLVGRVRERGDTVGVISVDPSSTFTGGALLGDRIRLAEHFLDSGVFIRSMATRGRLGGVAEATLQAALLLDAAGVDVLLLETVGTGQSEIEIARVADTVVLVLMPGAGDAVQALKAGVMEIPDVIALNKREHPHARATVREIRAALELAGERDWKPPVIATEAVRAEGVEELWHAIECHREHLGQEGRLEERRRRNLTSEVFSLASGRAHAHLEQAVATDEELRRLLGAVERRELDPLSAVREILERVFRLPDGGAP